MSQNPYEAKPADPTYPASSNLQSSNYPTVPNAGYDFSIPAPPPPPAYTMNDSTFISPRVQPSPERKKKTILTVLIVAMALLLAVGGALGIIIYNAATAPTAHYPFSTNLVLNDPLSNASNAAVYGWGIASNGNGGCTFAHGAYEVTSQQNYIYCPAHNADFSNFTYEVQMTIKNGGAGAMGGVIFRHTLGTGKNYIFFLGIDGSYELGVNAGYSSGRVLKSGRISAFRTGFNQPHTIAIVANGSQFSVYVDQQQVTQLSDTSYASGAIGMLSRYGTSTTTVAYRNAKVWQP